MRLACGTRVGVYEILSLLGSGGMGEVYRARDPRLKREVAIKVLRPSVAANPDQVRRFQREAQAAAALNHPNILNVFDVVAEGGTMFLVSELLGGEALRAHVDRGAIPVEKALQWAIQIADGLAATHEKGIVHRDLKPENIFITAEDRVKILDFGLAKLPGAAAATLSELSTVEPLTANGVFVGTIRYMAPERFRGADPSPSADIFSFGLVLHELLTGKPLFNYCDAIAVIAANATYCRYDISTLRHVAGLPLARIVARCLTKEPASRPSAAQVAIELRKSSTRRRPRNGKHESVERRTHGVRGLKRGQEIVADAEHACSKAQFLMDARLDHWLQDSFAVLQKALTEAPTFVPARIALSRWYVVAALRAEIPCAAGLAEATRHAEKAVTLAPDSAEALGALARAYYARRRFVEAELTFNRALQLNPSDIAVLGSYSEFLTIVGRHSEALELVNRALDHEPLSGVLQNRKACALFASREFVRCIEWCRYARELTPASSELSYFAGVSSLMLGQYGEAICHLGRALELEPKVVTFKTAMVVALERIGRGEESGQLLNDLERQDADPVELAEAYAGLNRLDESLHYLEEGFRRDSPHLMGIAVNALLDPVRAHPRFRRLTRALGLDMAMLSDPDGAPPRGGATRELNSPKSMVDT